MRFARNLWSSLLALYKTRQKLSDKRLLVFKMDLMLTMKSFILWFITIIGTIVSTILVLTTINKHNWGRNIIPVVEWGLMHYFWVPFCLIFIFAMLLVFLYSIIFSRLLREKTFHLLLTRTIKRSSILVQKLLVSLIWFCIYWLFIIVPFVLVVVANNLTQNLIWHFIKILFATVAVSFMLFPFFLFILILLAHKFNDAISLLVVIILTVFSIFSPDYMNINYSGNYFSDNNKFKMISNYYKENIAIDGYYHRFYNSFKNNDAGTSHQDVEQYLIDNKLLFKSLDKLMVKDNKIFNVKRDIIINKAILEFTPNFIEKLYTYQGLMYGSLNKNQFYGMEVLSFLKHKVFSFFAAIITNNEFKEYIIKEVVKEYKVDIEIAYQQLFSNENKYTSFFFKDDLQKLNNPKLIANKTLLLSANLFSQYNLTIANIVNEDITYDYFGFSGYLPYKYNIVTINKMPYSLDWNKPLTRRNVWWPILFHLLLNLLLIYLLFVYINKKDYF
ncbi:hypothetical protein [Spiroplasma endosymbiont of Dilophus febrilis]|uniref:hypothetical protein n=1 Tax=Spiroplasma endosymbiont of Dilophus febrilis TaxID=3066292 RepID=UPI00313BB087